MKKGDFIEDTEYEYQYHENGNLKRKTPKVGVIGLDTEYYENGNIKHTMEFDGNQWNGKWLYYYDNGNLGLTAKYKDGKLNGYATQYYKSGNISSKYLYRDDEFNGTTTDYYNNGQISGIRHYRNGQLEGKAIRYYKDGNIKSIRNYKNGLKYGTEIKYNKNRTISKTLYIYGIEKSKTNKEVSIADDISINTIFSDAYRSQAVELIYDNKNMNAPHVVNKSVDKQTTRKILKKAIKEKTHIHKNHTLLRKLLEFDINEEIPSDLYYDVATALHFACYLKALRRA